MAFRYKHAITSYSSDIFRRMYVIIRELSFICPAELHQSAYAHYDDVHTSKHVGAVNSAIVGLLHTHTHTHTDIYIYVCVCVCVCN
jgi:hypothetical protein